MNHLNLPKKADWMTLEESADNLMDSRLKNLLSLLDEHVLEKEFFLALDNFYKEAKKIIIRGKRDEFDKNVLLVIEALIREKFKINSYIKFHFWRYELHLKTECHLHQSDIPDELLNFLTVKKNIRIENVVDLFYKNQKTEWYNPFVNYVGVRPCDLYEVKILFKTLSEEIRSSNGVSIKHEKFKKVFSLLAISQGKYISFKFQDLNYILATKKIQTLSGESVEILLVNL